MKQRLLAIVIYRICLLSTGWALCVAPALADTPDQSTGAPALVDPAFPQPEATEPISTNQPLAPQRLPKTEADSPMDAQIEYAGGAVKFTLPEDWYVGELPSGRSIRLLLSPVEIPEKLRDLRDGVWLTYRYRPASQESPRSELLALLSRQTKTTVQDRGRQSPPVVLEVDAKTAVFQELNRPGEIQELHLLARTREGLFTLHLVAPAAVFAQRRQVVLEMLDGMKLTSPDLSVAKVSEELVQAAPVVGSWKALRSRLLLSADGRVVTIFDLKKNYAIDSRGYLDYKNRVERLTGKFVARDDLILITWDDGSRLNYRWRVSGGQLFLTDHHGRVSQLERLFQ